MESVTEEVAPADVMDPVASVYPNPVKDLVTLHVKNAVISAEQVQVIDSYGKLYQVKVKLISEHSLEVDLTRMSTGMYIIRAKVDNGFKTFRVMKQ